MCQLKLIAYSPSFPTCLSHPRKCSPLNYIRNLYLGQARNILQQRLKKNLAEWTLKMKEVVRSIKSKLDRIPALALSIGNDYFILETNLSYQCCGGLLIENNGEVKKICMYPYGTFKAEKLNHPSSHKEILVVKVSIARFKLYLNLVKCIVKKILKHMPDIINHVRQWEKWNNRILKNKIWLDRFDFKF